MKLFSWKGSAWDTMLNILVFNYQKAKNVPLRFTDNNFDQPLNLSSLRSELLLSVCTCNKYCTQLSKYCCYPSLHGSFYKVSGATTQRTAWQQRSWPAMMVTTMMVTPQGLVTRTPATTGATDQSRCTAQWPMLHPQTPQLASKYRWQQG